MPFAVPIHNWSALKDSVNWAETLIGMNTALKNHMVKYNRLIDTLAQLTRDWNSDISQLQVSLTGTHSIAKDANTRSLSNSSSITNLRQWNRDRANEINALKTLTTGHTSTINSLSSQMSSRINEISNLSAWNKDRATEIGYLQVFQAAQLVWNATLQGSVNDLKDYNKQRADEINVLQQSNRDRKSETDKNKFDIVNLQGWNKDRATEIGYLQVFQAAQLVWNATLQGSVNDLKDYNKQRADEIIVLQEVNRTRAKEIGYLQEFQTAQLKENTSFKNSISDLGKWNKDRASEITYLQDFQTAQLTLNDKRATQISSLDNRLKNIETFDFGSVIDLTVLVIAINAVGTKVQKLVDLFNVDKVLPGTFTFFLQAHIKTQTDAITQALAMVDESLNDNFINYFDDSKNGKFWTAFKKFSDFQMAVFFGVFFETLDEKWEENWLDILETWNITNDLLLLANQWLDLINSQLSSANNTLAIVTQWLKQIYEKPLGNINNEAGTNLWDFLESIVDNLGEIITTQLKEFVKVLDKILDFLDGLIDKIIGLLIPEDTNFITNGFEGIKVKFNVKFGALLGLADSLKDLFTPTPRDFKQAVSFDFLGAKFEPDFSMIDPYVKKFRVVMSLSLWMSVVVFIFRKITGTGDLVNDN